MHTTALQVKMLKESKTAAVEENLLQRYEAENNSKLVFSLSCKTTATDDTKHKEYKEDSKQRRECNEKTGDEKGCALLLQQDSNDNSGTFDCNNTTTGRKRLRAVPISSGSIVAMTSVQQMYRRKRTIHAVADYQSSVVAA